MFTITVKGALRSASSLIIRSFEDIINSSWPHRRRFSSLQPFGPSKLPLLQRCLNCDKLPLRTNFVFTNSPAEKPACQLRDVQSNEDHFTDYCATTNCQKPSAQMPSPLPRFRSNETVDTCPILGHCTNTLAIH